MLVDQTEQRQIDNGLSDLYIFFFFVRFFVFLSKLISVVNFIFEKKYNKFFLFSLFSLRDIRAVSRALLPALGLIDQR